MMDSKGSTLIFLIPVLVMTGTLSIRPELKPIRNSYNERNSHDPPKGPEIFFFKDHLL